ncbi:MAG TPA: cellulose-binding protein [Ktedonobacteraceae bacterium]|nr:cellulose-binding protein [Ktedonobacteraceae bacterium]
MVSNVRYFWRQRRWYQRVGFSALFGLLVLLTGLAPVYADTNTTSAQVTINLRQTLSTLSPLALGVNAAVWDGHLQDAQVPGLLRADGVQVMRFPGGSTADNFHWQTNTLDDGSSAGLDTFDKFMQVVQKVGATPIITVNYGTGTPEEAAAWVKYANVTKHYHIQYWEIGNELYGNGTYGANWESDKHAQGPASYASNSLDFIKAMKAADPHIKIGLVLTAPGNWPDGQTSATSPQPWNDTVLANACSAADFAVIHWYPQGPGGESDASLLAAPANGESTSVSYTPSIPSMVSTLHSEFNQYCGSRASKMQIFTTETNSVSYNPGKQTTNLVNALYLADSYLTWLANGVTNVDWWDIHNSILTGDNNSDTLYGTNNFGDYGMLSVGDPGEPAAETPFPAYYGLQMVSKIIAGCGQIVAASSNQSLVHAYAVKRADGSVAVLLINADPSTTYTVSLAGLHARGHATVYTYGEDSTSVSTTRANGRSASTQVLAPYSLTAVVFHP